MIESPRPVRLNNPGDIESGTAWIGLSQKQDDPRFCGFESAEYGFRALCKILLTYHRVDGLNTISQMIARWAPPEENDTQAYIAFVSKQTGIDADAPLDLSDTAILAKIAFAISIEEAGHKEDRSTWFTEAQAEAGAQMALA